MIVYRVSCVDQYGHFEENGFYFNHKNAVDRKNELDLFPQNTKYGIVQNIDEIEIEDEPPLQA